MAPSHRAKTVLSSIRRNARNALATMTRPSAWKFVQSIALSNIRIMSRVGNSSSQNARSSGNIIRQNPILARRKLQISLNGQLPIAFHLWQIIRAWRGTQRFSLDVVLGEGLANGLGITHRLQQGMKSISGQVVLRFVDGQSKLLQIKTLAD